MRVINLLRADGSIIVNKKLAHAIGIDGAIMYSELISKHLYFETKEQLTDDGYFFNTVDNMEVDTLLTKYKQSKAIKTLVKVGLVKQVNRGIPQKRFFKLVDNDELLLQTLDTGQKLKNSLTSSKKTKQIEVKKLNSNNTNSNITKSNNTKSNERYTITSNGDPFLNYYNYVFNSNKGKDHPTVTKEQLSDISIKLDSLISEHDIRDDEMQSIIRGHLDNLSEDNDGKIFAFIGSSEMESPVIRYKEALDNE